MAIGSPYWTLRSVSKGLALESFLSYAQNGEDVVLWRAFSAIGAGTYIDVGANHPTVDSVTRAFYDRGWSGLLIEPDPESAELLRRDRPRDIVREAVISDQPGTMQLHSIAGTGLSTLVASISERHRADGREVCDITVESVGLSSLLDELGIGDDIQFVSIDTEGAELGVLRSLDLSRHRPWVLVVEATAPNSTEQVHAVWEPILLEAGYLFCLFDGLSRYYLSQEHADLAPFLSYPACALDEFVRYQELEAVGRADRRAERAEAEAERLRLELADHRSSMAWRITAPLRHLADLVRSH